jgi:LysM repeat protein
MKMQMPKFLPRKKLHATARRIPQQAIETEPNMKLSTAVMIVLVLHVVAVGGIYAFSSIRAHRGGGALDRVAAASASTSASAKSAEGGAQSSGASGGAMKTYRVRSGDTLSKIAANAGVSVDDLEEANGIKNVSALRAGQELKIPAKPVEKPSEPPAKTTVATAANPAKTTAPKDSSAAAAAWPKDSGDTHVVVKGENPVTIAKKLGVNYDDLMKLNKIDDPKKLKIGQKLRIPMKRPQTAMTKAE